MSTLKYPQYKDIGLAVIDNPDCPIYKYFPLKYLLTMLQNRSLAMGKVKTWDDVYENFLFKQPLRTPDGISVDWSHFMENVYGQCWTYLRSSDAMWRIYSKVPGGVNDPEIDNVAVRIETTPRKLWDVIYNDDRCMADTRIGKVRYLDDAEIYQWLIDHSNLSQCGINDAIFESMLIKRTPFEHEHELRVNKILDTQATCPSLLFFDMDPDRFITEMVIEPRITDQSVIDEIVRRIRTYAPSIPLRQSDLYHFGHNVNMII